MQNFSENIVDSVVKIKEDDWDSLFGDAAEGYAFFKTLEESKLDEFNFYYVTVYEGNTPVLIAPVFTAVFDGAIASDGVIRKAVAIIRKIYPGFLIFNSLFCGSPFAECGMIGIKEGSEGKKRLIERLVKILNTFSKKNNISLLAFKDFLAKDTEYLCLLLKKGFFRVESFPSCVTELNFNSFEGYLKSLSHSTRKSLRRKIRQADPEARIDIKEADNVDDIVDDIYPLYENTYNAGSTKFERLTKEFFIKISNNLKGRAKYFLYYVDGKLAAFNLCFVYEGLFIDKFIGFDYSVSNKYNLYFVSWCYNIEWCLKNRIRYYQSGQTDYEAKKRLGGRLVQLYAYFKHRNRLINSALKLSSALLKPDV